METLRGNPASPTRPPTRIPPDSAVRYRPFRCGAYIVRLAGGLPDLEACLKLERRRPAPWRGRLAEPTAVPDCDFLVAADLGRRILGACRLLPCRPEDVRHALPGAPRAGAGDPRFAGSAPLLTALRYASRGVLEVGDMVLADGLAEAEAGKVAEALWEGLAGYMASLAYGYALGRELVMPPEGLALEEVLRILQDDHGLHPDLEAGSATLPRPDGRRPAAAAGGGGDGSPDSRSRARDWLPEGFREGLHRGIHLIGGPRRSAAVAGGLEFAWVASSELLRRGERP